MTHGQNTEDEDLGMAALFQETERPGPSDPTEVAAISPTTHKERSAQGTGPNDWPWETYDRDQLRKMQQEDKDIAEFLAYREVNVEKPKYGEIAT